MFEQRTRFFKGTNKTGLFGQTPFFPRKLNKNQVFAKNKPTNSWVLEGSIAPSHRSSKAIFPVGSRFGNSGNLRDAFKVEHVVSMDFFRRVDLESSLCYFVVAKPLSSPKKGYKFDL